jgi:hypothetical protein
MPIIVSTQLTTDSSSRKSSRTMTSSFRTTWSQSSATLAAQLLLTPKLNLRKNARYHMNAMKIEKS